MHLRTCMTPQISSTTQNKSWTTKTKIWEQWPSLIFFSAFFVDEKTWQDKTSTEDKRFYVKILSREAQQPYLRTTHFWRSRSFFFFFFFFIFSVFLFQEQNATCPYMFCLRWSPHHNLNTPKHHSWRGREWESEQTESSRNNSRINN